MMIKKAIGYFLISVVVIALVYYYVTQLPWWMILVPIFSTAAVSGFIRLLSWLFKDSKTEEEK